VAKLSVREAAKRFDVSRPTLVKHLKSGKISGEALTGGGWLIDPAEMVRAGYAARLSVVNEPEPLQGRLTTIAPSASANFTTENKALAADLNAELAAARADLEKERILRSAAEALAAERAAHIEDLRRMLPAPAAKAKRGWWPF
jgi:excisionase family DNA binding protein